MGENVTNPGWIGGYHLRREIGRGGTGVVWEAEDGGGTLVAFKLLHPSLAATEAARTRLRREARLVNQVRSPRVSKVLDVEADDYTPFVVTELVTGRTLDEEITRAPYTPEDAAQLGDDLADVLEAIHEAGIAHRDLKPSNVILTQQGPTLIDFGIAQGEGDRHLTQTGSITGTPGYVAPELLASPVPPSMAQLQGGDWFAWSALLLKSMTGRPPFGPGRTELVIHRVMTGDPDVEGLEPPVAAAFRRALSPDPAVREDADALLESLSALDQTAWLGPRSDHPGPEGYLESDNEEPLERGAWNETASDTQQWEDPEDNTAPDADGWGWAWSGDRNVGVEETELLGEVPSPWGQSAIAQVRSSREGAEGTKILDGPGEIWEQTALTQTYPQSEAVDRTAMMPGIPGQTAGSAGGASSAPGTASLQGLVPPPPTAPYRRTVMPQGTNGAGNAGGMGVGGAGISGNGTAGAAEISTPNGAGHPTFPAPGLPGLRTVGTAGYLDPSTTRLSSPIPQPNWGQAGQAPSPQGFPAPHSPSYPQTPQGYSGEGYSGSEPLPGYGPGYAPGYPLVPMVEAMPAATPGLGGALLAGLFVAALAWLPVFWGQTGLLIVAAIMAVAQIIGSFAHSAWRRRLRIAQGHRPGVITAAIGSLWRALLSLVALLPGIAAGTLAAYFAFVFDGALRGQMVDLRGPFDWIVHNPTGWAPTLLTMWGAGLVGIGLMWIFPTTRAARLGFSRAITAITPTSGLRFLVGALLALLVLAGLIATGTSVGLPLFG